MILAKHDRNLKENVLRAYTAMIAAKTVIEIEQVVRKMTQFNMHKQDVAVFGHLKWPLSATFMVKHVQP